jgi:hypothetical protein
MSRASWSPTGLAAEAAKVFERLTEDVGPFGVIALVAGADGETVDLCICSDDDAVEERSLLLLDLYAGDAAAVVFATSRAGTTQPTARDCNRFRRLREHGERVGLPVVDWLVFGDAPAVSLASIDSAE